MRQTFKTIWKLSGKRHDELIKGLLFSFLRSVFGITQLFALILTVGVFTEKYDTGRALIEIAALMLICIIGNFITSYFEQMNTMKTSFLMTADMRVSLADRLRHVPLGFFNRQNSGKVSAVLTTVLSGVESASAMVMVGIVSGLFNSIVLFIFMLFYEWRIGLIAGAGMIAYLLVVRYEMKVSRKNAPRLQIAQADLAQKAVSFLKGIKVIKSFSVDRGERNVQAAIEKSRDENIALTKISMPSQFMAGLTIAVFESIIFVVSIYLTFNADSVNIVKTFILMIFSFMVYQALNQAGSMLSMIGLLDSGLVEAEKIDNAQQFDIINPIQTSASNTIVFDDVSFKYEDRPILKNISTTIEQNSLTAVVGPSGAGKTTFCQLIARFHDIEKGTISIGGADITHMEYEDIMKKISMVFQNVYLFEDTILNNIRLSKPDASIEEVRKCAKMARCDDFIMQLPDGYNTVVEEGGSSLSGGEKQRISIARALLKDSPIIILDEATGAMDAENESEIMAAIDELIRDKTVIMIAHRLKTVEKADHIIVLEDGEIESEGKHDYLLQHSKLYKSFVSARENALGWSINN